MLLVMGHMIYLCLALCTLKPRKPKKPIKKIPKNLGFFQPWNPTVPFWSPTVVPSWCTHPPLFEFCAYLRNCMYYYYSHYFFCKFFVLCYRLGCIIHKLVEFNAYSVVLCVSCRPIVYITAYCCHCVLSRMK